MSNPTCTLHRMAVTGPGNFPGANYIKRKIWRAICKIWKKNSNNQSGFQKIWGVYDHPCPLVLPLQDGFTITCYKPTKGRVHCGRWQLALVSRIEIGFRPTCKTRPIAIPVTIIAASGSGSSMDHTQTSIYLRDNMLKQMAQIWQESSSIPWKDLPQEQRKSWEREREVPIARPWKALPNLALALQQGSWASTCRYEQKAPLSSLPRMGLCISSLVQGICRVWCPQPTRSSCPKSSSLWYNLVPPIPQPWSWCFGCSEHNCH